MKVQNQIPFMVGTVIYTIGAYSILAVPFILIFQAYKWLESGEWFAIPLSLIFQYLNMAWPSSSWGGVQKIFDWQMHCPISGILFIYGIVFVFLGMHILTNSRTSNSD